MFAILYDEAAEAELRAFGAYEAHRLLDEIDEHLANEPTTPSRRRKLFEGLVPPWESVRPVWQLRIGDFRVFYDVEEARRQVVVRAIRRKSRRTTKEIL